MASSKPPIRRLALPDYSGPFGSRTRVPVLPKSSALQHSRRADNGERLPGKRSIDLDDGAASGGRLFGQARRDRARHRVNALGFGRALSEQRNRLAGIAADADSRIDLDFAKQRHAIGFRDAAAFSVAKDVNAALAMRAIEETHVLDDPENIHVDLAEHFEGLD